MLPRQKMWTPSMYSLVKEFSPNYYGTRGSVGQPIQKPKKVNATPRSVEEAVNIVYRKLDNPRVRLHAGFFNETLTVALALSAKPALYVDLNCDLFTSTRDAYRWLLTHRLLQPGTIVGYDDWFQAPFLRGGESLAHCRPRGGDPHRASRGFGRARRPRVRGRRHRMRVAQPESAHHGCAPTRDPCEAQQ